MSGEQGEQGDQRLVTYIVGDLKISTLVYSNVLHVGEKTTCRFSCRPALRGQKTQIPPGGGDVDRRVWLG